MGGPGSYCFGKEEQQEVMDVLASGHLSRYGDLQDPNFKHKVYTLEQELSRQLDVKHALATSSGTAALYAALLALGIGPGDEVLVPGYTYVASISSIIYAQATPVLVEIDNSLNIDPRDIEKKITERTKSIMPVHMLGNPCDLASIMKIAKRHNLYVIEDTAQAIGASFKGKRLGTFGDIGVLSFNRYKMMAGEGGMLITNNDELYERAFAIHDQGHRPNRSSKDAAGSYIGVNLKMNELTGAVALAQSRKLDWMLRRLKTKKELMKSELLTNSGMKFRKINDPSGECSTVLTVIFNNSDTANKIATLLSSKTMINSGWHVYRNMTQIGESKTPVEKWPGKALFATPTALPQTNDILSRSFSISIGVLDNGLGTGFGTNIHSTESEIKQIANQFNEAVKTVYNKA